MRKWSEQMRRQARAWLRGSRKALGLTAKGVYFSGQGVAMLAAGLFWVAVFIIAAPAGFLWGSLKTMAAQRGREE